MITISLISKASDSCSRWSFISPAWKVTWHMPLSLPMVVLPYNVVATPGRLDAGPKSRNESKDDKGDWALHY